MGGSDATPKRRNVPPSGVGQEEECPSRIATAVTGPAEGIAKGMWLDVRVDRRGGLPRVVLVDNVTGAIVGALAGIPDLAVLIRCLEGNVLYRALVDNVDGGRIDVTVLRG